MVGALLEPECRQIMTCGVDRQLRLHDLASGMQVYCKTLSQQPSCVAWRQHRLLVGTVEGLLLAWDLRQVRQTAQVAAHQGAVQVKLDFLFFKSRLCLLQGLLQLCVWTRANDLRRLVGLIKAYPYGVFKPSCDFYCIFHL